MTICHKIALFNHKGGVAKTTTAVNLAACLAQIYGQRCLVVDVDPQANATRGLMGREVDEETVTLTKVLMEGALLNRAIVPSSIKNLFLVPADLSLSEAEFKLVSRLQREFILRDQIEAESKDYDFLLLDCPPSLGILSLNALAAVDAVMIPCETQFLSLRGLKFVLEMVNLVKERLNPKLKILGVVATKFYPLSRANHEALACLQNLKEVSVFQTVIPRDVKAEEAPSHGQPLISYAPESRASEAYRRLAEEVLTRCRN